MEPLVSVVLPTYNRANLIRDTISSVLTQTYEQFELIIADDGSTDNTEEIVTSIYDKRITYLKLPHVGLPATPRNRAIEKCKGEFVAFLDSDDLWLPRKIEQSLVGFISVPTAGLVCSNEFLITDGKLTHDTLRKRRWRNRIIDFQELFQENIVSSSTAIVRKKCLRVVGYFNEAKRFRAVEDYHLWLRIASRFRMYYIDEPLGYYRDHSGGLRFKSQDNLKNLYNTLTDIYQNFPNLIKNFEKQATNRIRSVKRAILKDSMRNGILAMVNCPCRKFMSFLEKEWKLKL